MNDVLLEVDNLVKHFSIGGGFGGADRKSVV